MGWNRHKLLWGWDGTDKCVPWTTLLIIGFMSWIAEWLAPIHILKRRLFWSFLLLERSCGNKVMSMMGNLTTWATLRLECLSNLTTPSLLPTF